MRSELFRYELDLKTGKARRFQLNGRVCELPHVNPRFLSRRHSHVYAPASAMDDPEQGGPTQSLLKVTVSPEGIATSEAWFAGERRFVLEPTFVPRKGAVAEDDGWLLFLARAPPRPPAHTPARHASPTPDAGSRRVGVRAASR